jgi:Family of unknown function (DUF6209)
MEAEESTAWEHVRPAEGKPSPSTAVLRFRHTAAGSGISRSGHIRPGGRLLVEYDPARLPPSSDASGATYDILCHARFNPRGQLYSGRVAAPPAAFPRAASAPHEPFHVRVPTDAREVELWFESRGPAGTTGWDSRYGQNYVFVVGEDLPVPQPAVMARPDALVDPGKVRVVEDAATKEQARVGGSERLIHSGPRVAIVQDRTLRAERVRARRVVGVVTWATDHP